MKWFLVFIPFLFQPLSFAKKSDTVNVIIVDKKIPNLNKQGAVKIWKDAFAHLKRMKQNCNKKVSLEKKIIFAAEQMEGLVKHSKSQYDTHKYSLPSIKNRNYNGNKGNLGVILLDIQKILSPSDINYKQIKTMKNHKKSCEHLRDDFVVSYKKYYNVKDNASLPKEMIPWAKSIYQSLDCLCS